jgi:hypothetical protein
MKKASSFHKELFLRRLKIAALIIIPAGLIVAAGFFVYRWEGFRIVSVEVSGNIAVKSDEIISSLKNKAENSFFGRLLGSDHILAWKSLSAEDISADIFRLDDISLTVNAEERKVNITVREREESAIWCAVSSVEEDPKKCFWMDDEGNLFAIGPDAEGVLVRVINDRTGRPLDIKNKPLSEDEMNNFKKISSIFSDLDWIISDISLKDASSRELTAKVSTGQEMIFNLSIDPLFGIPVIKSLIESGEWPRVQYLDLRIDGKGFYKLN